MWHFIAPIPDPAQRHRPNSARIWSESDRLGTEPDQSLPDVRQQFAQKWTILHDSDQRRSDTSFLKQHHRSCGGVAAVQHSQALLAGPHTLCARAAPASDRPSETTPTSIRHRVERLQANASGPPPPHLGESWPRSAKPKDSASGPKSANLKPLSSNSGQK